MKRITLLLSLLSCTAFAHEPYLSPVSHFTQNKQIAVLAGYAEEALNSEYAIKDLELNIISPTQQLSQSLANNSSKSVSVFDVQLPETGTYLLEAKTRFPIKYVQDQNQWKIYVDLPIEKAGAKSSRDYVIPQDFKVQPSDIHQITREWTLQSYVTKMKSSEFNPSGHAPIQVVFETNPTQFMSKRPHLITLMKDQKKLTNALIKLREKGKTDKQAIELKSDLNGQATLNFSHAGEYLIEVNEMNDPTKTPSDQYYTIVTLTVN